MLQGQGGGFVYISKDMCGKADRDSGKQRCREAERDMRRNRDAWMVKRETMRKARTGRNTAERKHGREGVRNGQNERKRELGEERERQICSGERATETGLLLPGCTDEPHFPAPSVTSPCVESSTYVKPPTAT
uniref:Uncharacterized protein n=1 Tax=Esox lucius TaxID=8010 RepID=A0A3P8ZAA9_ESOLU